MKSLTAVLIVLITLLATPPAFADQMFPKSGWQDEPDPLASVEAVAGGKIAIWLGPYPKSLNYYLDSSSQSAQVFSALFESLLRRNSLNLEFEPALASRWSVSSDKRTFTFYLDKKARWSNGKPVTAYDVRFTYDTIMNPKNLTGPHKLFMGEFEPPQVIDPYTIRFVAKTIHWRNLMSVGGLAILSKEAYQKQDFNKINFDFPVVSGPYRIGAVDEGNLITLKRRVDWWGRKYKNAANTYNFDTVVFKFFAERENAFEAFKKGLVDLFPIYTARQWVNGTKGERFSKNWIIKQKVFNHKAVGFQGFAMNMRKSPFNDVRVRNAMAHLVDRRKINATLMYNQYFLHRSYFEDLYSKTHPNPNPLIELDKQIARRLLKQAGWIVNPQTGYLEKKGRRFRFTFLTREASTDKFLTIFMEDLKDVGIEMVIERKDWAAWARDMDEHNFQMTWAAWGAGLFKDPEGMWHSKEADRKGGSNITGFKDKTVDDLIEAQKTIFDINKRNDINRKIDAIVYQTFPYVLLWNINYTRLLYWNKFGMPDWVLSKYGDESSAFGYWWYDPDAAAELQDAMAEKETLPYKAASIDFDDQFD